MQSGVSKTSVNDDRGIVRSAFVRLQTGISRRCCVLKEARDGSTFVVELDNRRVITVSARHLWFEGNDSGSGSSCVVCFASGFLLSCKECRRLFHEDCSSMPRPKASSHSTTTSFTCRDCFFMLYTARTGMENRSIARSSLLLIKEVKKYSTYAYRELLWDALFRTNKASMYCYCGGPGRYFNQMVQCLRCLQWFHRACLHTLPLDRGILPWDCFWYFKCAHCNGSHGEVIRQLPVHWTEILHIAIMNLMAGKSRFCFVNKDILPWLEKNWSFFRPSRKVTLSYATEENIIRHLQLDPARFQCGLEVGATRREWRARCYISGPVRQDLNPIWPVHIPISQERLNDIALERAASEDLPLLILNPNAKLPSIEIFTAIYGNRERYRTVKLHFDSSRLECYNRTEKNCVLQYRPDEDRTAWLSFPDPASLLRRRLHVPLADTLHDRKHRKRKLPARSQTVVEKQKSGAVVVVIPDDHPETEQDDGPARKMTKRSSTQEKNLAIKDVAEKEKRKLKEAVVQEVTDPMETPVVDLDSEETALEVVEVENVTVKEVQVAITETQMRQEVEKSTDKGGMEVVEKGKTPVEVGEKGKTSVEVGKKDKTPVDVVEKGKTPVEVGEKGKTSVEVGKKDKMPVDVEEKEKTSVDVGEKGKTSVEVGEKDKTPVDVEEKEKTSVEVGEKGKTSVEVGEKDKTPVEVGEMEKTRVEGVGNGEKGKTPMNDREKGKADKVDNLERESSEDVTEVVVIEDSPIKESEADRTVGKDLDFDAAIVKMCEETILTETEDEQDSMKDLRVGKAAGRGGKNDAEDVDMTDIEKTIAEMLDVEESFMGHTMAKKAGYTVVGQLPKLRLRSQAALKAKSQQVARKSGRPLPLHQPSPPPKPCIRTRECSVPLINFRNWYEITGDAPPRTCDSGARVLQTIPSCLHDQSKSQPFLYRWEAANRPRLTRAKLICHGLPARHATSTPLKPQNPRKKSEYETDGVVTVLAKRRQNVTADAKNSDVKGGIHALKDDEEDLDGFSDLLLLWNRKLVRLDRF